MSLPLGKSANDVWHRVIPALALARLQINLLPITSRQQPLVGRSVDVAAVEHMFPNMVDAAY